MDWGKVLGYTVLGLLGLVVAQVVLSVIASLVWSIAWTVVPMVLSLLVLGGLAYGGYWLFSSFLGRESSVSDGPVDGGTSRVERLQEQYKSGEISETELERRLERELDGPGTDSIERELRQERS